MNNKARIKEHRKLNHKKNTTRKRIVVSKEKIIRIFNEEGD